MMVRSGRPDGVNLSSHCEKNFRDFRWFSGFGELHMHAQTPIRYGLSSSLQHVCEILIERLALFPQNKTEIVRRKVCKQALANNIRRMETDFIGRNENFSRRFFANRQASVQNTINR